MQTVGDEEFRFAIQSAGGRGRNPAPRPTVAASAMVFQADLGGTGGTKLPDEAGRFAKKQAKKARALGTLTLRAMPAWLDGLTERHMTPAKLVAAIFRRTLEHPTEASVLETGAVLNEVARDPKAAAIVSANLIRDTRRIRTRHHAQDEEA